MKKLFLFIFYLILSLNFYSQTQFEKGYFIDDNDIKTICFIKNLDWNKNPSKIEYKKSETSELNTATIKNINEFGFSNIKYKRFTVDVDKSSTYIIQYSYSNRPEFKSETVFLKLLVKGNVNLYRYSGENNRLFFYSIDDVSATQLVYKKYKSTETEIKTNESYKQQLLNNVKCDRITVKQIKKLKYFENDLVNFFQKYNTCENPEIEYKEKEKKDLFNLTIRPGLNLTKFSINRDGVTNPSDIEVDFGNVLGFRIGVETEFFMPFNNNKWSFFLEPIYNQFSDTGKRLNYEKGKVDILYKTLEVPIGIRYHLYLNQESNFFINASYILIFDLNSNVDFEYEYSRDLEFTKRNTNIAFGIGYCFKDRYGLEIKYFLNKNLNFANSNEYHYQIQNTSLIFGYTIF
ncbi:MAG: tRNA modification GTPase [Flavobacteriaceae bacterium]|nr:tRNA modification GTPase [Flavobacteriaceae bacterium]